MSNIQVTHDTSLDNARSESSLAINPNNTQQIVAGSKKFINYHTYDFTLATSYSIDGGLHWNDSAPFALLAGWTGISDPAIAWDDSGNVFLVGLAFNNPPGATIIGIAIYKSTDGGQTWSPPNLIHTSPGDDKQWAGRGWQSGEPLPWKGLCRLGRTWRVVLCTHVGPWRHMGRNGGFSRRSGHCT
jgi:hypothetical protein